MLECELESRSFCLEYEPREGHRAIVRKGENLITLQFRF
jgi:hypothetical protein